MALADILHYIRVTENIATSGQPDPRQLQEIAKAGFQIIINLAMPDSDFALADEFDLVQDAGMAYFHIPVPFDAPTSTHLRQFINIMAAYAGNKIWIHCALNYRASAFIYNFLTIHNNIDEQTARQTLLADWQPDTTWQAFMALDQGNITNHRMAPFLQSCSCIDWHHPAVWAHSRQLTEALSSEHDIISKCFAWVRDHVNHSYDFQQNPVTCKASDVLLHRTGYCYAKSHLLTALLRANDIPAGLCYQRLSIDGTGPPFSLHGLVAVYVNQKEQNKKGWLRIDARGNKPGIRAEFAPPGEQLAFPVHLQGEADLPEIWAEPLPAIVKTLQQYTTWQAVYQHLPDIELL